MKRQLGFGRGFLAVVINVAVVIGLEVIIGLVFGETSAHDGSASVHLSGGSALIWLGMAGAYLILPKIRSGQTIGRMLVGGHTNR